MPTKTKKKTIVDELDFKQMSKEDIFKKLKLDPFNKQDCFIVEKLNNPSVPQAVALRAAGYSESSAVKPSEVTSTKTYITKAMSTLDMIKVLKEQAAQRMNKTVRKAKYRDVSDSFDKLVKNERLASGQSTENIAEIVQFQIPGEE